jgi:hypothetical protein
MGCRRLTIRGVARGGLALWSITNWSSNMKDSDNAIGWLIVSIVLAITLPALYAFCTDIKPVPSDIHEADEVRLNEKYLNSLKQYLNR